MPFAGAHHQERALPATTLVLLFEDLVFLKGVIDE